MGLIKQRGTVKLSNTIIVKRDMDTHGNVWMYLSNDIARERINEFFGGRPQKDVNLGYDVWVKPENEPSIWGYYYANDSEDVEREDNDKILKLHGKKVVNQKQLYIPELDDPDITIREIFDKYDWFKNELK